MEMSETSRMSANKTNTSRKVKKNLLKWKSQLKNKLRLLKSQNLNPKK